MDNNFPCLVRKKIGNRRLTGKEKGMKEKKINLHLLFNGKKISLHSLSLSLSSKHILYRDC